MGHITVLGAGIVGIGCALWLQRDGHDVTLIDRDEPASGCSRGNAGLIQCASVVPLASPGTLRAIPKMLLDPNQPLVIRWRHLPSLTPFLAHFLRESRPSRVEASARALADLVPKAWEGWSPLLGDHGLLGMAQRSGELHVYTSEGGFRTASRLFDLRRRLGVAADELTAGELRELEPALAPAVVRGVMLPDAWLTTDPYEFASALARAFVNGGGRIERVGIRRLTPRIGGGADIVCEDGTNKTAPSVVIALGAYSKPFALSLGLRVPLDTERGYHAMLPDPGVRTQRSIVSGDWRFAMSPLSGGLRLAGTAELARVGALASEGRAHRLIPLAQRLLPGLQAVGATTWMGHRPSMPDSRPVIGPIPGHRGIWAAFGHGHSGLTLGGITGRILMDMMAGRPVGIDPAPFSPARFARA